MTVKTAKVAGRRQLRFSSYDDILEEAERLAAADQVKTLGNWSLGQNFQHLAHAMNMSIDGLPSRPPWYLRLAGRMLKNRVLNKGMSPGFNLPERLAKPLTPKPEVSIEEALSALRAGIERLRNESHRESHPAFGKMSNDEWDKLHFRHAELHLSFVVPVKNS